MKLFFLKIKRTMKPSKYIYFSFNRVQKCSEINHMNPHNLAMVFSSCLFQTKGQTSEEVNVIEDLIKNYVQLFDVGIFILKCPNCLPVRCAKI